MSKEEIGILSLIGKTPLVRLVVIEQYFGLGAKLYAKLEMFNPTGSVKDRTALGIVRGAISDGRLFAGGALVEATSGNMGISLSMLSNIYGYRAQIVMPRGMSKERQGLIKSYGGQIVLIDGGMKEAIERAEKISKETGAFFPRQFTNVNGMLAHLETGREISEVLDGGYDNSDYTAGGGGGHCDPDCTIGGGGHCNSDCTIGGRGQYAAGDGVDFLVSGVGTGGTISGAGRFLKEKNPKMQIVAVEPAESAVLSVEVRKAYGIECGSDRMERKAHGIEGIGAGFFPPLLDASLIDEVIAVSTEEAKLACSLLTKKEGIFAGISSGAALFAAINLARRKENENKTIAVIFPDGGEKYLSKL